MTTYVLVHGAWLGGWCWPRVVLSLVERGHEVFTPTLTGLGERAHLATPEVGLETHVQDICNVLFYEDLRDIILVGHSYSGFVVSAVASRMPERVKHLVYVAAAVPTEDGVSMFDLDGEEYRGYVEAQAAAEGEGWRWPLPDYGEIEQNATMHMLSKFDQEWLRDNAVPHPVKTFADPVSIDPALLASIPKTYIRCTRDYGFAPDSTQGEGWRYRELHTGHWPMFTQPAELAELLTRAG